MNRVIRAVLFASAVGLAAAAGCAESPITTPNGEGKLGKEACANVNGSPVSVEMFSATLRKDGYALYSVPDPPCPPQMVGQFSNVLFRGKHENIDEHDEITEQEGQIICDVEKSPPLAMEQRPWDLKVFDDGNHGVELNIANISCVLFADSSKSTHLRRLRRTLKDLDPAQID